jgi:hypothetical protein
MKLTEGYNLINGAKFWYQMMWTSWSRGQATHNDDKTLEKQKTFRFDRNVRQLKPVPRHHHSMNTNSRTRSD